MKILKYSLFLIIGLVALIFILGLTKGSSFELSKEISVKTTDSAAFEFVSKWSNFKKWSPWQKLDPEMKQTINGTDGQPGSSLEWSGKGDAGMGIQTQVSQIKNKEIKNKVKFTKPFESEINNSFTFTSTPKDVTIRWTMYGEQGVFMRGVTALMGGMEKMLGKDLNEGLENIKKQLEQ